MTTGNPNTEQPLTRVLMVAGEQALANRVISSLRQAGMAVRPALAADNGQLEALLAADAWDVLVLFSAGPGPGIDSVLAALHKHALDTPVILAGPAPDSRSLLERYRLGIRDQVSDPDSPALTVSILREAAHAGQVEQLRHETWQRRELEARHQQLLADSPLAISYLRDGLHLYCNPAYAALFGYDDVAVITTTPFLDLIAAEDHDAIRQLLDSARAGPQRASVTVHRYDDSTAQIELNLSPVEYQGRPCLQLTMLTSRGNSDYADEVTSIGHQDLLTRLDNRSHFFGRIETAIRKALHDGEHASLILLEVDDFEDISTTLGKSGSNILLNDIAHALRDAVDDRVAIGRIDTHTFGILLPDGNPDSALSVSTRVRDKVNNQIASTMRSSLELNCSVGMSLINGHALDARDILWRARINMEQRTDDSDPGLFHIADSLQHDTSDMLAYLELALRERRFRPAYQPIVGISSKTRPIYELLIRMLDREDNEILPGAFLPLANLNGLGEQIDRMVITMALEALQQEGSVQQLIVNITSNTLVSHTFLPWLSEQLGSTRIRADSLVIDISEVDLHVSGQQALTFCQGLEELGVRLTLSHFGGALDPFATLETLQPQLVTLDETVVRDLIYSSQQKANVKSMVAALHARGLQVVTPRVEDMAVLPVLWELGVDYVQGYCVQAPRDEMNFEFVQDEEITLTAPSS